MTKTEFLGALYERLAQLPEAERRRQCDYYAELLDDMIEDGEEEQAAVAGLGGVSEIAGRILRETPLPLLVRSRVRPAGGWTAFTVVLLIFASPVWLPLVIALAAVVFSVYVVLWALIVTAFAVVFAIAAAGVALFASAVFAAFTSLGQALAVIGGGIFLAGLAILAFFAALAIAKALVRATVAFARWIKSLFIKKEICHE